MILIHVFLWIRYRYRKIIRIRIRDPDNNSNRLSVVHTVDQVLPVLSGILSSNGILTVGKIQVRRYREPVQLLYSRMERFLKSKMTHDMLPHIVLRPHFKNLAFQCRFLRVAIARPRNIFRFYSTLSQPDFTPTDQQLHTYVSVFEIRENVPVPYHQAAVPVPYHQASVQVPYHQAAVPVQR